MDFLYDKYEQMLDLLKEKEYSFCGYADYQGLKKSVILRHDVDFCLEKALDFAKIESYKNVRATYFILLSTNFYNVLSKESYEVIKEIKALGHEIGLHFDEKRYEISDTQSLEYYINKESKILEELIGEEIKTVSMHRPSKWILENDINFEGIINTYSNCFFKVFKYLSDSRMFWREDVLGIIKEGTYDKLHILTHPFWYSSKRETMKDKLVEFITQSKLQRYDHIRDNFRDIEDVLNKEELF